MPALKRTGLAAVAAAALLAAPVPAAPRPVRVIVGSITIDGVQGQTPDSAIRFLEKEFARFLGASGGKQEWPEIFFEPIRPAWPRGDAELRDRLSKAEPDVLAYIPEGSVGRGVRAPVVKYSIVIRPPGTPSSFAEARATMARDEGLNAQHMFVIAFAVVDHAYRAGNFGLAAAIADRVAAHVEVAKKWGPSLCVQELSAAIARIGAKARQRIRPGAVVTDGRALPATRELPSRVPCDR